MNQKEFLELERSMDYTNFPMRLCLGTPKGTPGNWTLMSEWDWSESPVAQFKTIGRNEIALDFDITDPYELYFTAQLMKDRLTGKQIPHIVYDSGGKGYHFQIWLWVDEPFRKKLNWRALRNWFVRYITKDVLYRTKKTGRSGKEFWSWNIDPKKWSWDDYGAGSVIRTLGGRKKFYKYMVDKIPMPDDRRRHSRPVFPDENFKFEYWHVPAEIIENIEEKVEAVKDTRGFEKFEEYELPICIENLVEMQQSGVHLNHMQRICVVDHLWKVWKSKNPDRRMNVEEIDGIKSIFAHDPEYDPAITDYQVRYCIDSLEKSPRKVPRCSTMRRDGMIDTEFCEMCRMFQEGSI